MDAGFLNCFLVLHYGSFHFFRLLYRFKNMQLRDLQVTLFENKGLPVYFATDATTPHTWK